MTQEYTIDIYLRQRWHDPRLAFDLCDEYINLTSDWLDIIWVPDMFFLNSKSAMFHDITLRNVGLHISPNGSVFFTQRLGITLGCVMELLKFPLDVQKCDTQIMSYTHKADELTILWFEEHEPVQIDPHVRLPQTKIRTTQHGDCWRMYEGKNYSCIYVEFELQRLNGFYVIQIYVPGVLIVMLSWVSFWLDPRATPARVSLGLLCVLTTTTHTTGVNSSLPRVSYIKAMDVWNFTCLLFVFGALLEFALINVKTRKEEATAKEMLQRKSRTTSKKQANKTNRWEMSCVPFAPAAKSEEEKVNGVEVKQDDVKGAMYWTAERLDKTCLLECLRDLRGRGD
ncbi:glycine receptor subunit alpha-2-like [Liolophura sinensis]|uniref:glycine receptor subunit alpha-2-like n=1 Tax=Liolophura sinensis TaxID=3198878 RepID=UPI00315824B6